MKIGSSGGELDALERFRSLHDWTTLEQRYYRYLAFIDVEEEVLGIKRKKRITQEEAKIAGSYSVCYFDAKGRPVRIDKGGSVLTETYLIWHGGRLDHVVEFFLGYMSGRKRADKPSIVNEWRYRYDDEGRMVKMVMVAMDGFAYNAHRRQERHRRYEHDEKGVLRTYQWLIGVSSETENEWLIYDRERELLLAKSSVSKSAYIARHRGSRKPPPFKRSYYEENGPGSAPWCTKCDTLMTYFGYLDTSHPILTRKPPLQKIPIYCCLNCLEGGTFDFQSRVGFHSIDLTEIRQFPEQELDFVRTSDPDEQQDAPVKIGGAPDWIQDEEHPLCPSCGNPMLFACQLNSDEQLTNGIDGQMFGDSGKLYTFTCCDYVTTVMQYF